MRTDKILSLVGLAKKAGYVKSGEFSTEKTVKSHLAKLVIVSEEASDNTKKKFRNMCTYYEVPIYFYGGKEELGKALGKEFCASIALEDQGLADAIMKQLGNRTNGGSKYDNE